MPQTAVRVFRNAGGVSPVLDWLSYLEETEPKAHAKCLARILALSQLGSELRRPLADILRDGIYELRCRLGTVNYRILYFFMGANIACLSHGLTKEGGIPAPEIDLAVKRKHLVKKLPDKYTAAWE